MKLNNFDNLSNQSSNTVSIQARRLMQQNRQKRHNRTESMVQRTASELGIDL